MPPIADPPERSLVQQMEALGRANEIRSKRAALKRELKAGRVELAPLLIDPPEWLASAKVADVLGAVAAVGPVKTARILRANHVSPSKTILGLSDRQRAALVVELRARRGCALSGSQRPLGVEPESQHMQALGAANVTRLARADLKHRLAAGETTVVAVLAGMPDEARTMPMFDLLMTQRQWGRARVRRLLVYLNLSESKPAGTLTARQVKLTIDALNLVTGDA